ncbi:hypothetical protein RND71_044204 [Anisodus tanguticus]|uniref:Uncharacterized protein n=1 Tax=Anisodus tanguticus TaxID=243964 RepID=A0AAE1QMN7_9SOLA|nr:hypothetical protein RND71_044204 [Anisodus tanguticus]
MEYAEKYKDSVIRSVFIRIYYTGAKPGFDIAPPSISNSDILSLILDDLSSSIVGLEVPEAKSMNKEKPRYSNHITAIKPKTTKLTFIVADTETLLDEKSNAHVPDAVGYMLLASNFPDVASSAAPQAAANHANQMTRSFSNSLDYKEREAWKPLDFIIKGEELKEEGNKDPFSLEQGQEVSSLDGWLPRELKRSTAQERIRVGERLPPLPSLMNGKSP